MYFYLKLLILFLGFIYEEVAMIIMLIDAHFHLTSDLTTLKQESPDWQVFGLMGKDSPVGSEKIHKIMGLGIFLLTVNNIFKFIDFPHYKLFTQIVIVIISTGTIIKYRAGKKITLI